MITASIAAAATAAAYRLALKATASAPQGSMRARLNQALGGGGPVPELPK